MNSEEKRFIAVKGSLHKKPRAMFLSTTEGQASAGWDLFPRHIIAAPIDIAIGYCRAAGVPEEGVYFIDAENINDITEGYQDTEIKLSLFILMCVNLNRQIIRYCKEQLLEDFLPPIIAPSEQALSDEALREIAKDLANQPTMIYCKNNGEPISIMPDDEQYIYLLYTETADGQRNYYRSENAKATFRRKNQQAEIFEKLEAQKKTKFPDEDGRMWYMEMVSKVLQNRQKGEWREFTPPPTDIEKEDTVGTVEMREKIIGGCMVKTMVVTDENGKSASSSTVTPLRGMVLGRMEFQKPADDVDKDLKVRQLEPREYVVFRGGDAERYKFYNVHSPTGEPNPMILGQSATLLTESEAESTAINLSRNTPYSWFYYKIDYFLRKEQQAKLKNELVEMLDNLPQNRPLYKDSGSWQIRTDDMEEVLYEQAVNESFFDFIKRAFDKENFLSSKK
jgi:hypothetical protein